MRLLFKSMIANKATGWPMGFYGCSQDGNDYCLDTHNLKADEVPLHMHDAKTFSELIAGLLNAFYKQIDATKLTEDEIMRMGRYVESEDVPKESPNQIGLPF